VEPVDLSIKLVCVPVIELAWARNGDKGDSDSIGSAARGEKFLLYLYEALNFSLTRKTFKHFKGGNIFKYFLPRINRIDIVLEDILGVVETLSLQNDPQGKGYAQLLLSKHVK